MNAIAHIDVKTPRLTKQGFVAGGAAAVAVAGRLLLGIRLRFHNHAPEQLTIRLAFHQQAADELRCHNLSGAAEEGLGEVLGRRGGYGSGFRDGWIATTTKMENQTTSRLAKTIRFLNKTYDNAVDTIFEAQIKARPK